MRNIELNEMMDVPLQYENGKRKKHVPEIICEIFSSKNVNKYITIYSTGTNVRRLSIIFKMVFFV